MSIFLSACLIVKDEERCLDRCLTSLRGHVDEIIVVDTGSTDDTVNIAKSHGAKIFNFEWIDDFSAARNYSIEQANGKYVLVIDADEYISPEYEGNLHDYIKRCEKDSDLFHALYVAIENFHEDANDSIRSAIQTSVRIIKNMPSIRYCGRIHEAPMFNGSLPRGVPVANVESFIPKMCHDGYLSETATAKNKPARNLDLLLRQYENEGEWKTPTVLYYIGREYMIAKNYSLAKKFLTLYAESGYFEAYMGPHAYVMLLQAQLETADLPAETLRLLNKGMQIHQDHPYMRFTYANFRLAFKQNALALDSFEDGIRLLDTYNKKDFFMQNSKTLHHQAKYATSILLSIKRDSRCTENALELLKLQNRQNEMLQLLISEMANEQETLFERLCELYDMFNLTDVQFVLDTLKTYRLGIAYLLVYDRYYKLNPVQDLYMFSMMTAVGEYKGAVDAYLARIDVAMWEPYWFHAWAAAMCSRQPELMMRVMERASSQHQHLFAVLDGFALEEVTAEDVGKFKIMLTYLYMTDVSGEVVAEWAAKAERLGGYGLMQTAQTLERHGLHELELECLLKAKEIYADDSEASKKIMVLLLKCYYALGDYENAYLQTVEAFEKSDGYAEIGTYAQWLVEKVDNNRRKARLRTITDESNRRHIEYISSLSSAEIDTAEGDSLVSTIKMDLPPLIQ